MSESAGRSPSPAISAVPPAASEGPGLMEPLRYNDWRQVEVAAPGAFVPELPARPEVEIVCPVHPNPEVGGPVAGIGVGILHRPVASVPAEPLLGTGLGCMAIQRC